MAAAERLTAQMVHGRLIDQYTNQPIAGATVGLVKPDNSPMGVTAKTDNNGNFSLRAPGPGVYRLSANIAGYIAAQTPAFELGGGDDIHLTWRLLAGAVQLRPIAITSSPRSTSGRLGGFYDRMQRHGFGYFISSDQIQKQRPFFVSDLLRTVPGLQVLPSGRGFGNIVRTIEGCTPAIFLDGVRFPLMGESIDDIVNPMNIEGIEVYPHATEAPAEFMTAGNNCGVIAIWTKR
jgi:hypothetical protein